MKIEFHGHSCIQITTAESSLIIDPFIRPNPLAKAKVENIRVQYVLLTHAHMDHIADAAEIAKNNDATIVTSVELATYLSWQGVKTLGMNIGGAYTFDFGKVKLTQAIHSSGIVNDEKQEISYMGLAAGFVLTIEGKSIYFAGDTSLFYDMKLIGEQHKLDVAFLPIGDFYTMGPEDALLAAEWLKAKVTIPVHYDTFPGIRQDGQRFIADLNERGLGGKVLAPGESFEL